jgi:hypothetical protein
MVGETLQTISSQLGMPIWLFGIILVWIITWKLIALWKSARKGHIVWFIFLAIINTIGILEILYIFVFSKLGVVKHKVAKKISKKKRR